MKIIRLNLRKICVFITVVTLIIFLARSPVVAQEETVDSTVSTTSYFVFLPSIETSRSSNLDTSTIDTNLGDGITLGDKGAIDPTVSTVDIELGNSFPTKPKNSAVAVE